jgi:hypothetical protein
MSLAGNLENALISGLSSSLFYISVASNEGTELVLVSSPVLQQHREKI